MGNIIVAFPKLEDAKSIKNLLVRHGFSVNFICTTGSQVLECIDGLGDGIIICGYKFPDMVYHHLHEELPKEFEMLLVASNKVIRGREDPSVISVAMPLKVQELLQTVAFMDERLTRRRKRRRQTPRSRDPMQQAVIAKAKQILMEHNNFTEEEAHRYVQKCSMDSGNSMVETAQMIISIMQQ